MDELREKKTSLLSSEVSLNGQEVKLGEKLVGERELLKDGNIKLKDSLSKNNKPAIDTAQIMIETAAKNLTNIQMDCH